MWPAGDTELDATAPQDLVINAISAITVMRTRSEPPHQSVPG